MEVFALDLAVREQGAATVEQSLARVQKEAQGVATAVNRVGQAAVPAMANTERAATKAAVKVTGLATQFAATGNISVAAIGGITEALNKLGLSVGTGSLFAAAIVGIGTLITSQMAKVKEETKRAVDAVLADARRLRTDLNAIADAADQDAIDRQRRRIQNGLAFATPFDTEGLTAEQAEESGIVRVRERLAQLEADRARQRALQFAQLGRARTREEDREYLAVSKRVTEQTDLYTALTQALANLTTQQNALALAQKAVTAATTADTIAAKQNARVKGGTDGLGTVQDRGTAMPKGMRAEFKRALRQSVPTLSEDELADLMNMQSLQDTLTAAVAGAIAGGFASGIAEGIARGNFGAGFQELVSSMLSGLGSAVIQFGIAQVKIGTLMQAAIEGLRNLNPVVTIAAGAALVGLGRAMGGSARQSFGSLGRGTGSSTGSGATGGETVTRIVFGPTAAGVAAGMTPRDFKQFIIIGPNDPTAQRGIQEVLKRADGRGSLR